jgi:hypothetical protein
MDSMRSSTDRLLEDVEEMEDMGEMVEALCAMARTSS